MNVAFMIYNRPDLTARVFETIRRARPDRLLVVADGPKSDADARLCAQARSVVETVDWQSWRRATQRRRHRRGGHHDQDDVLALLVPKTA